MILPRLLPAVALCTATIFLPAASRAQNQLWMAEHVSTPEQVDSALATLKSPDADERVSALRSLMTSLDPRLPEALLPLLRDEGDSVRRLAARAVGSRWWQIPTDRLGAFLEALRSAKADESSEDALRMQDRGIGLLTRKYKGEMFSRSPDERWVIYERFFHPCLIDTKTSTEELLGMSGAEEFADSWFAPAWGNGPVAPCVLWHPKSQMAMLDMTLDRRTSTLWIWRHGKPALKLDSARAAKLLTGKDVSFFSMSAEPVRWEGNNLMVEADFYGVRDPSGGGEGKDCSALFAWNALDGSLSLVRVGTLD